MKLGIRAKLLVISLLVLVPLFAVAYFHVAARLETGFGLTNEAAERLLSGFRTFFAVAFLVSVAAVGALSSAAALIASRTARELAAAARRMAEGEGGGVPPAQGQGEFGELGAALEQLARGYSNVVADYRRERDRMRGILAGMREGVLLFDRRRRVALVNPALREMLLLPAEVEGKSPLEVVRHGELVRLLDEVDEKGEPAYGEIELLGLKPRRLLVQVVRIPGEEGGLLAVFIDVTLLRRLEALRKDFVANASHELRTPVAAIHSAAETLETAITKDPGAAPDFVAIIVRNASRLKNLVDDLLDLSRIEAQDFEIQLEPLDVGETSGAVLDLFRERAQRKGIELVCDVPESCFVRADRRGIEHVLTNLVDNAVKYCGAGSRVSVRAVPQGSTVRLVVEDDGPGIAKEHLPRIFERFYRVDPGRSRQLGGTGLGLSIVRHLVEAMGGRIDVESELGRGTRFGIHLAAAEPSSLPDRVTNPPPAA